MNKDEVNQPVTVPSPAKINLFLRVGPKRPDGFHGLISWFCVVGLADELTFAPHDGTDVSLSCNMPSVPCDATNLILRAASALRPYASLSPGIHIHLHKRIPMGGGLGGGSSNAAATLSVLSRLWRCDVSDAKLREIGATLGSDVPFFLQPPSAICRGRGELISPISAPSPRAVLLLLPDIVMPTPAVFRQFDEMKLGTDLGAVEADLPSPQLSTEALLASLANDLEAPAFAISPALGRLRSDVEACLGRPVRMSGSGSTLFTIYDNQVAAAAGAKQASGLTRALACTLS